MRDVSFKPTSLRTAKAQAVLTASPATLDLIRSGGVPKGDPLPIAKVAAVMAAKKTTEWIPYCHNIPIEHVTVDFELDARSITVEVSVTSIAKTGVEMEALTAAAAAVLNLYDMLKMLDDDMEIGSVRLLAKTGGKSDLPAVTGWAAAVLTCSDRASSGEYQDTSGPLLADGLKMFGASSVATAVVPDSVEAIQTQIQGWCDAGVALIMVTGGTGVGPRDVTPEALGPLIDKPLPGVVQTLLHYGQDRTRTAMLSRSVAGLVGTSLVVAIPGSPAACRDALAALFPSILHVLQMVGGGGHA